MPPSSVGAARTASRRLLTQIATVYGEDVVTGRYTVILRQGLACRLISPMNRTGFVTASDRAEWLAGRDFWWDATVTIPEQCQIEVDNVLTEAGVPIRWQIRAGTLLPLGDASNALGTNTLPVVRRCMVVRIQTSSF